MKTIRNVQECWQLEGWDISGTVNVDLGRKIAEVAHIRSQRNHGWQSELKRGNWIG